MNACDCAPEASIIMPVYNGGQFLPEALASITRQSFSNYELIAIDDGSTDSTPTLLREAGNADRRIRILTQTNSGVAAALNAGLQLSRSPIIIRMDADDVMMPNRLAKQVAYLKSNPSVGLCGCAFEAIGADSTVLEVVSPGPQNPADLARMIASELPITLTHPTVAFSRALALSCGGYKREYITGHDMELFNAMILKGAGVVILRDVLMKYRVHDGSISGRKISQQLLSQEQIRRNFYRCRNGLPPLSKAEVRRSLLIPRSLYELQWSRRFVAEFLKKKAAYARSGGRRFAQFAYLALAGVCRPEAAIRATLYGRGVRV